MASPKTFVAPRPEVLHLPTILRRVESGEIRIPDFQRKYVWLEKQVIELLGSVYKGYPIGSILFWRAQSSQLRYDAKRAYPFPTVERAREPISFLLDGQQRLSTLYGCLYLPIAKRGDVDIFNVTFDLRSHQFEHADKGHSPASGMVPLWSLFSPSDFLAAQRVLQSEKDGERLLDESVKLHAVFQEYMIPTVTIEKRRVNEVVEIFERVNRTGTKLGAVDFMRAVTWSAGFDLGKEIHRIERSLKTRGFTAKRETIVKAIAIALGTAPTPDAMLELRERPVAELADGAQKARRALLRTVAFLKRDLQIHSDAYVPYEGQLLVLSRVFMDLRLDDLADDIRLTAKRWFLAASVNESLRGKPDHVVSGLVVEAGRLVAGKGGRLPTAIRVAETDFLKRRLIRGKALSTGAITLFALSSPRSIISGKEFEPREFMSDFNSDRFAPIVSLDKVRTAVDENIDSARILANVVVMSLSDLGRVGDESIERLIVKAATRNESSLPDVLSSQIISRASLDALRAENYTAFLRQRSKDLLGRANNLTRSKGPAAL